MANEGLWNRYRDYISVPPINATDKDERLHIMARAGYPMAFIAHVVFMVVFWWLEIWPLFWFNVASVFLWAAVVWTTNVSNRFEKWAYVSAQLIEIPAHGVLATLYFGIEPAFNFYIVNTVVMVMIMPFIPRSIRIALSCFYVFLLAGSGTWAHVNGAIAPQGQTFNVLFFAANTVVMLLVMAMCMGLYEWSASVAEKRLMDSRKRTEIANHSLEGVSTQLAKYISPQLYQAILSGQQEMKVDSKRKKLTIFFSDIVGFTETTDQLQSEELTALLNEYLTEMSKIAQAHNANFDKFIGDAIVLYFGDPDSMGVKEDAAQCVRMAIKMQKRMHELRQRWLDMGLERPFEMRIGINTGYCTVGNFGSEDRMDYTIIGGEVNLAARLESLAEEGGILLAHETWSLVKNSVLAEQAETVSVKGIARPVKTYRVRGIYDDLTTEGRIIHHEDAVLSLTIDRDKMTGQMRERTIELLENTLAKLQKGKG